MRQKPSSNNGKTGSGRDFKGGGKGAAGKGFGGKRDDKDRSGGGYRSSGRGEDGRDGERPARFKREDKPEGKGRFGDREDAKRPYKRDDKKEGFFGKPDREKRGDGDKDRKPFFKKDDSRGDKRPYQKREESGSRSERPDRERKSYGDREEKRPYKRREDSDNRGERPDRERKSYGDREEKRPYKRAEGDSDRKPSFRKNDGEQRGGFRDRDEKRPFKKEGFRDRDAEGSDRPKKRFEDRDDKKPYKKNDKEGKDGEKPKRPGRERFEDQDLSFGKGAGRNKEERKPRRNDIDRTEGKEGENNEVKPKISLKKIEKAPEDFTKAFPLGDRKVSGPFRKQFAEEQEAEKAGKPIKRARKPRMEEGEDVKEMTLNKYIAHSGTCSRRDAAEMVKAGKVKINGELALDPGYRVQPYDVVTIAGKKLTPQKNRVYILLNKPKGFLTTTEDPEDRKTVMDLVNPEDAGVERLFPVGRLDRNTTGLILLTNDGDLAQKLSHPSYEIKKVYQVSLNKALTKVDFEKVVAGVELEDGVANVDALAYLDTKEELGLEIHSGRNRIVRRIFESLGYEVDKLDRVMYAGLTKKNLPRGKWRFLEEKEVILLKHFKS
ncbi:MAG: pseudouridine synthase [Sphingobacteriales bacterium]|nr:MAG: pseudouridine synthase [Sphingobacteriales bacterium]